MTQQPELFEVYRAGLKSAGELMKTSLENAERFQNQQLAALRAALEQHTKGLAELDRARSMDELLGVQMAMTRAQVERFVAYWLRLYQTQMAAYGDMQSWMAEAREWFNQAAAQAQSSARQAEAASARAATTAAPRKSA
jgi:phage-related minor tail protein